MKFNAQYGNLESKCIWSPKVTTKPDLHLHDHDRRADAVVVGAGVGGLAGAHALARTLRRDGPGLPRVAVVEKGSPIGVARGSGIGLAVNGQRALRGIDPGGPRWRSWCWRSLKAQLPSQSD